MAEIVVNGEVYVFDENDELTFGELEQIAPLFGGDMRQFALGDPRSNMAIVWVAMHRKDPTVTMDDVRKLKVGQVDIRAADEPDPFEPEPDREDSSSSVTIPVASGLQ